MVYSDYHREYTRTHKKQKVLYDKNYRIENIDKIKKYKKEHREETNKTKKVWRDENKEHLKLYKKQDYSKNKDKYNEIRREKYSEDPEKVLLCNKKKLGVICISLNMNSMEYHNASEAWSKIIKKRDKVCQVCGSKKDLNAHHLFHRSKYPQLSLNLNNGTILCKICHGQSHGYQTVILLNII